MLVFNLVYCFWWIHGKEWNKIGLLHDGKVVFKAEQAEHATNIHGEWWMDGPYKTRLHIHFNARHHAHPDCLREHEFALETDCPGRVS